MAVRDVRTSNRAQIAALVLLVVFTACSQGSTPKAAAPTPRTLTGAIGAASYEIDVPAGWNGTLFLYSHGYVAPGGANGAQAAPVDFARTWLLDHHYAAAGSSYSSTGWALEDAFRDQMALLDYFGSHVDKPKRVIAWGASLGGIITAGLVQLHPDRFAAAMPLCGVLSGGIATWNAELDSAYAFKTLLAAGSALQLTHITDAEANRQLAAQLFNSAASTLLGRARLGLVAALIDLPGWFDPRQPEPAADDYAGQLAAQQQWESRVGFNFAFDYRQELERRAGGNPSWNAGVNYNALLAESPDRAEVIALYAQAGLDLQKDLRTLNAGATIKADRGAAAYLDRYISFDGNLSVPMLSMHTTGDGLVIPPNESAYAEVVATAAKGDMLRQLFVHRAGHCTFTPGETIAGLQVLLERLDTGRWDASALQPAALNTEALAQGAGANQFFGLALEPSFVAHTPAPYPRPHAKGQAIPT
ncbi:MAG: alpha/beta hydrolase [Chloroflexi bacterium]|nr:MAG: alpha/beta hydrolase [Chloroflexota bacterium]TMF35129.1 MAG: alpha/beta hydrolase [Chloroflexota bacterium]